MNFRMMTFNLRYDEVRDGANAWPFRIGKVTELLASYQPLIVGTQEGLHSMLMDMQQHLPQYGYVGEGRYGGFADEHNAIFYHREQLDVVEHGQFWLSEQPMQPGSTSWDSSLPRICTWAHVRGKQDRELEFKVFNTHLDHRSQLAQEKGIQLVLEQMQRHSQCRPLPMVLMGDFNADPDSRVISLMEPYPLINAFDVLKGDPGMTFHDFKGGIDGKPIDYLFSSPAFQIHETVIIRDCMNGGYPSDHYPVMVEVALTK